MMPLCNFESVFSSCLSACVPSAQDRWPTLSPHQSWTKKTVSLPRRARPVQVISSQTRDSRGRLQKRRQCCARSTGHSFRVSRSAQRPLFRRVLTQCFQLLYLLSFLDRSSVGNAKAYGMLTSIHAKDPNTYNNGLRRLRSPAGSALTFSLVQVWRCSSLDM